jgi:DNA-binding NtrC family response regulator
MAADTRRILYVDADCEARLLMQALLASHTLDVCDNDEDARVLARRHSYDIYIVGGGAPASVGLAFCAWLHRVDPRTPIVYCSSNPTARHQQLAIEAGALRYQLKPLDPVLLKSTLGLLLKLGQIESQRAVAAEQEAIHDELLARSNLARDTVLAARAKAQQALDCMLRAKAYRAFRDAGGNRANFERMWPSVVDQVTGSPSALQHARAGSAVTPLSASRGKR